MYAIRRERPLASYGVFLQPTKDDESLVPLTFKNIGSSLREIANGFVEAFKLVPFRKMCIATFLIFNAFNTVAAFSFFIIVYHLFNGDAAAAGVWPTLFGSVGALITTFAVIPTVTWMSKKMGKKNAFMVSQGISIFGYILLWFLFVPGKPYMFIFALHIHFQPWWRAMELLQRAVEIVMPQTMEKPFPVWFRLV